MRKIMSSTMKMLQQSDLLFKVKYVSAPSFLLMNPEKYLHVSMGD